MVLDNQEIQSLIKIMGFYLHADYTRPEQAKNLRYGSLMLMTDQDHDGSHIKGLLINFLHYFWPSLLKRQGFLKEFVTPIIKVISTSTFMTKSFFTIADYELWARQGRPGLDGAVQVKYYKGLGTSTSLEAKEYFGNLQKHVIYFDHRFTDDAVKKDIELAFDKKLADARKEWLKTFDERICVDHSKDKITYSDFIHKELIHFSVADNRRSIPSLVDGLKPG